MKLKTKVGLFTSVLALLAGGQYLLALHFHHPVAVDIHEDLQQQKSALHDGASMLWAVTAPAISKGADATGHFISTTSETTVKRIGEGLENLVTTSYAATVAMTAKEPDDTVLSEIKEQKIIDGENRSISLFDLIAPSSGDVPAQAESPTVVVTPPAKQEPAKQKRLWDSNSDSLTVDAVLVPRSSTVISSSQDGKIAAIPLQNGDSFLKGDVLIQYDCADLEAEAEMAGYQKDLTQVKSDGLNQLFKLDIISDIDRMNIETENRQAKAKMKIYESKLSSCTIKADFDGHVTKRLANAGEYTRTDRVLMEIASDEPLEIEFLLPSKWLRWVNVGAPLRLTLNENDQNYEARVTRIFGEVDPVSQSIQIRATLESYDTPLLPGMSGKATLSVASIESAGVHGYLQSAKR